MHAALRLLCFCVLSVHASFGLRTVDGSDPLVPDYDKYYYTSLTAKMVESLSFSNCTMHGISKTKGISASKLESDLTVREIIPSKDIISIYKSESENPSLKLFVKASPNLCTSKQFLEFKKGYFKRGKGCYEMIITDRKGNKLKRINRYGATLHPDHVRCDVVSSSAACVQYESSGLVEVDQKYRALHSYPFIVEAKNVIVAKSGFFALPCGPFGLISSCEAVKWGVSTAALETSHVQDCRLNPDDSVLCPYRKYNRVFLISQYDDTQIGQFMTESFPRLVYHLDFLKANPDIYIHFGFTKQPTVPNFVLPHIFINWLGLGHRLINGTFFVKEAIMSREGGCQEAGYQAWELLTMREKFLSMSNLPRSNVLLTKPSILIIVRSTSSRYVQNKFANNRNWPTGSLTKLIKSLSTLFPRHDVKLFKDSNSTLMNCPPCQVRMFYEADVVIGMHGAGMANNLYMRPGSVVVEVVPEFDSRMAPLVGIFPRLSGIVGLHHYTYYIKGIEFDPEKLALDTADYYNRVKLWSVKRHV